MDPVSLFFSSYMDLVSSRVYTQMADMQGIELESLVVRHEDMDVPFSYQLWRIKPESVCDNKRHQVTEFSKCTIAAKSLFNEACNHLQANREQTWKHRKLKNMYCNAAISFKPTIANIGWSEPPSELAEARSNCNVAIAEFSGNPTPQNLHKRDELCAAYKALKGSN